MLSERTYRLTRLGWGLAVPVLLLAVVGLLALHATDRNVAAVEAPVTPVPADLHWTDAVISAIGANTVRQAAFFISGVVLMLLSLVPSYQKIGRFSYLLYGVLLVPLGLLVLDRYVDLPFIDLRQGARRWISLPLGLALQPSEFMKPVMILTLARYLRFRSSFRTLPGLLPPFLLTLVPMLMILRQPDLGTTLMLLPVLFSMLFVAGARKRHLALVVLTGLALLPVFYVYGMQTYQKQRVEVLWKQFTPDETWHANQGYQLRQALIALGTGGVRGQGFGQGMFIEHALLPAEHNDFIFAIIGHQWGLAGCVAVLIAFALLVFVGLEVALVTNDPFGRLLAVGVIVMIVSQALLNMCMNLGLAPITGMPLPFVSYGGSSLWANFIALGLLVNVAQRRPMLIGKPAFSHDDED
jgi:rod shape determining protein RodA